jgi:hypothetical protein
LRKKETERGKDGREKNKKNKKRLEGASKMDGDALL